MPKRRVTIAANSSNHPCRIYRSSLKFLSRPLLLQPSAQAFSSIDDTPHYRSEVEKLQGTLLPDSTSTSTRLARAEQRKFDTEASREEAERLDARDYHALLQPHVLYVSTKQREMVFSNIFATCHLHIQRCCLTTS
jgi:hypothetical protein